MHGEPGDFRAGVAGEVSGAGDQSGQQFGGGVERYLDCLAGGDACPRFPRGKRRGETVDSRFEHRGPLRGRSDPRACGLPHGATGRRARGGVRSVGVDEFLGNVKRLVGDSEDLLGAGHILGVERESVGCVAVGVIGGGEADVGSEHQEGRPAIALSGGDQRRLEGVEILTDVAKLDDPPAVAGETRAYVVIAGERGAAVNGDPVVVEDAHKTIESEMTGERRRLMTHPLHQAAIPGDHPGVVGDGLGAEALPLQSLRQRHADGVRESLTERSGRDLDAGRVTGLRVPGGA